MLKSGIHSKAPKITDEWRERWPDFVPAEFACKHCGEYFHDEQFLDKLQAFRYLIDKPLVINSGHRCEAHNKAVGGAQKRADGSGGSQHLKVAADISLTGRDRHAMAALAKNLGFTGIGYGSTFLHLDMRPNPAEWYYPNSKQYWRR